MKVKHCGANISSIVAIGHRLKQLSAESGQEYLMINRGINAVVNIDLTEVVKGLDFNSARMQTYPPSTGYPELREAINQEFFLGKACKDNIIITAGGMSALDIAIQSLDIEKLYLPVYYWGCYRQILTIRGIGRKEYLSHAAIYDMIDELKGNAILIGDPGNPFGEKYDDEEVIKLLKTLNDAGVVVLFDSPYRRVFMDGTDDFYSRLLGMENVIISESFSKSVGLSGQRIGFLHTINSDLYNELTLHMDFANNGVNDFAQLLILSLLTTEEGKKAVKDFKKATSEGIQNNIDYLRRRGFLATEYYTESTPKGIFAVVNLTQDELLAARIGSVSLDKFTETQKEKAASYSRICVSAPHEKFVQFFDQIKSK